MLSIEIARHEIARLRDLVDEQEETIRQLREALVPEVQFPLDWGLTSQQADILSALVAAPGGVRSRETLRSLVCAGPEIGLSTITVQIMRLRRKLKPFGIEIETRRGFGVALAAAARERLKAVRAGNIH